MNVIAGLSASDPADLVPMDSRRSIGVNSRCGWRPRCALRQGEDGGAKGTWDGGGLGVAGAGTEEGTGIKAKVRTDFTVLGVRSLTTRAMLQRTPFLHFRGRQWH